MSTTRPRGRSSLPSIVLPRNADPSQRSQVDALQKMTGQSGDGWDKSLTRRDFANVGGFTFKRSGSGFGNDIVMSLEIGTTYALPIKPTNVEVLPTFNTVFLRWDWPDTKEAWYSLTEIWRTKVLLEEDGSPYVLEGDVHIPPNFSGAVLLQSVRGAMATDYVNSGDSFVYWIRHVNKNSVAGPVHETDGTLATTFRTPIEVLEEYSQEIYASDNYQWLRAEVSMADAVNRSYQVAGIDEDSALRTSLQNIDDLNDYLAEQQLFATLDSYNKSQEVKAQFAANFAKLSGGIHAAVTDGQAYINRIQALEARWVNDLGNVIDAKITTFDEALTSPTGAIATSIRAQRVTYDGNSATFQETINSIATTEEALAQRSANLEARLGDESVAAQIETLEQAMVGPDGAIASRIANISVSYSGTDVSLQQLAQASATVDGKYSAQWGVKTNVDDLQGGVGFFNDGTKTSFVVDAGTFSVTGGSENIIPFVVKGEQTVIKEALIDHAAIYSLVAANIVVERLAASIVIESASLAGGVICGTELFIGAAFTLNKDANGRVVSVTPPLVADTPFHVSNDGLLKTVGATMISATMKDLTVLDGSNNAIMTSNGLSNTYIQTLMGVDATFKGTVYAKQMEGDVTDTIVKAIPSFRVFIAKNTWKTLFTVTVSALPFERNIVIEDGLNWKSDGVADDANGLTLEVFFKGTLIKRYVVTGDNTLTLTQPKLVYKLAADQSGVFTWRLKQGSSGSTYISGETQEAIIHAFKNGSTLS